VTTRQVFWHKFALLDVTRIMHDKRWSMEKWLSLLRAYMWWLQERRWSRSSGDVQTKTWSKTLHFGREKEWKSWTKRELLTSTNCVRHSVVMWGLHSLNSLRSTYLAVMGREMEAVTMLRISPVSPPSQCNGWLLHGELERRWHVMSAVTPNDVSWCGS
jgi:hypothetical protein